ncbi:fumarylacetoacetate hydrolase family protein [Prescottella agglutinans]|uniref:2-keto-4-pentenoate hydratase/2-oxohepta-3-ene-1,7-dioic acid hydratase in catechol pathway n=1 Tax=Prescottella agglutinans TaxID=1644129 RepID=A0ABT6M9U3_9NOCA|nr:fumarylacetoacetate hydrolase family protein [Prescottella agglutinans]MDH6281081.1 2-keto-4-pentenoate hydratase/2-oxohepta-3-ene-1,7-dioic acid hydratase in catechol pathway [Prescottella agglutinans]
MRLYCTDQGIGREDEPGVLSLLDLPWPTVDALVRSGNLDAARTAPTVRALPIGQASLSAPVRRPGKVLIVGLNYPSHAEEAREMFAAMGHTDVELPAEPNFQVLAGSSVVGAGQPIRLPAVAPDQVDYEGELAVVIGRDATDVRPDDAWGHVAGLSIANDVSARDIQRRAMTGDPVASIGVAKSFDTFTPLGPCLVTADEFTGPLDLRIRTLVNGELRQDDRTSNFLHSVPDLIAHISRYQTLEAGDIICTGTPRGAGVFSHLFLRPGDVVEVEVERVGSLRNEVVGE